MNNLKNLEFKSIPERNLQNIYGGKVRIKSKFIKFIKYTLIDRPIM